MDKNTFGDSDSAVMLASILDTHPTYRRKVSSMLEESNRVNNELLRCNLSIHLKRSFLRTSLERFKSKASHLDVKEVETFTQNVIKQNYRKIIDQL